jgi:hypothetical protein
MATAPLTVACGTCHTKFHVAGALVRGKVVKFRCKRCRGPIEVDGMGVPLEDATASITTRTTIPPPPPPTAEPLMFFGLSSRPSLVDTSQAMRLSMSDGWEGSLPPATEEPPRAPTVVLTDRVLRPPPANLIVPGARSRAPADDSYHGASSTMPRPRMFDVDGSGPSSATVPSARSAPPPLPAFDPRSLKATVPLPDRTGLPSWLATARPMPEATPRNSPTAPPTVIHESASPRQYRGGWLDTTAWAGQHQRLVTAVAVAAVMLGIAIVTWRHPRGSAQAGQSASTEMRNGDAHSHEDEAKPVAPMPSLSPDLGAAAPSDNPPPKAALRSGRGKGRAGRAARAADTAADGDLTGNAASAAAAMADVMRERELDPAAARAALDDAARDAAGCKSDETSAHFARFAVTFAPSGRVSSVELEGGPLANTTVGACMIEAFRLAQVPAFSGAPVMVHKSLSF